MCWSRSSRAWYLFVISIWLLLTVIRQIFDSTGRMWIPMAFNSFQIFSCICGLIAAIYWQKRLLIVFVLLNFTSILYNTTLILWYNEYFSISRDIPIFGIGFSHSYSQKYSKEILNLTDQAANEQQYAKPENVYIRNSAKNSSRKYYKETIAVHQNPNNFQKPFIMKRSQSMTNLKIEESNELINNGINFNLKPSLTNMIPKSKGSQIAAEKNTERTTNSGCVCRTGSLKNFTVPTTEGVRRILSHEEINLIDNFRTNNALTNSTNGNLKSLVSFDPKSNILLRIHNHIDNDDDDDDGSYRYLQHNDNNIRYPNNYSIKNVYYDHTSSVRSYNHISSNSLRQQPIWYSRYGDDIMVFII
ncbi:hypothetical protein DINM_005477 [Dirofilaria immitis]|nr:hypothetical protein [Dirofilaria immitis]